MREGKGGLEESARAEGKRENGRCAREGLISAGRIRVEDKT